MKFLTKKEVEVLHLASISHRNEISKTIHKPNMRVVNSLVRKGMMKNIMDTFFIATYYGINCLQENISQ